MRKLPSAPLTLCIVALISVLCMPAVSAMFVRHMSADSSEIRRSDQTIVWKLRPDPDPDPRLAGNPPDYPPYWGYWMGTVDFGDGMTGTAYFATDPTGTPTFPGTTFHFYEWFYIAFDDGGWILGRDNGVYLYLSPSGNWIYMANGWVTDASPNYADLIGYKYFEHGTTTDASAWEIEGNGFCFLVPA